jgi:ATP-dependent RNA helicase RhlE
LLAGILNGDSVERALVFTRTKHGADRVVRVLDKFGIEAGAIHGNKSQGQRERALAAFRDGRIRVLIATDIAARGIDVSGVSHVVNYDLPNIAETYVHRIGRTARAGAAGVAISLCSAEEVPYLRSIEKLTGVKVVVTGEAPIAGWDPLKKPKKSDVRRSRPRRRNNNQTRHSRNPNRDNSVGAIA